MSEQPDGGAPKDAEPEAAPEAAPEAEPDAAPEAEPEAEPDAPPGAGDADEKKGGKGKLIAIIAAVVIVVLLAGGGTAAYYLGFLDPIFGIKPRTTTATLELGPPVNVELPVFKADLKTGKCRSPLLRTIMVIRLGAEDVQRLQTMELPIMDAVRSYLRNLERQELVGRAGEERLRFDVTRIINEQLSPAKIHAIIFKEFLLQ